MKPKSLAEFHGLRTFARFAVLFGLAETRSDPGGKRLSRIEFKKTTVLDDFVRVTGG